MGCLIIAPYHGCRKGIAMLASSTSVDALDFEDFEDEDPCSNPRCEDCGNCCYCTCSD